MSQDKSSRTNRCRTKRRGHFVADKTSWTIRRMDNSLHGQMVAWTIRRRDKSSHRQIVARINSCGQNVAIFSGAKSTDFLENDDKE